MASSERVRTALLWGGALRILVGAAAVPLAAILYRAHFPLLVLMRPTKEVLLVGGFLVRRGQVAVPLIALAAFPLMVLGVWLFFYLGRAFSDDIAEHELPGVAGRILSRRKINKLQAVLEKRGIKLIFLGRLAALSSGALAAAAGSSGMPPRTFLLVDAAGATVSLAMVMGAGYLLGEAYERAGGWLTFLGFAALAGFVVLFGRYLSKE